MREFKDRIYFFIPTRMSLGILVAYRDDAGRELIGQDVETIYKLAPCDKDALIEVLQEQEPFAKLIQCQREGRRVPVVFTRTFGDRTAMYCVIELMASYADALCVTHGLGFAKSVLPNFDGGDACNCADVSDRMLFKYLNTLYSSNAQPTYPPREWSQDTVDVADEIMAICEFIGVGLELDVSLNVWEHMESRFSFRRCAELVAVFGCAARRYTKRRVLGVELCRGFDNFRLRFMLDFDSEQSEQSASMMLGEFSKITDVAIAWERGEICTYEAIPMELELEVAGVKEEF